MAETREANVGHKRADRTITVSCNTQELHVCVKAFVKDNIASVHITFNLSDNEEIIIFIFPYNSGKRKMCATKILLES